MVVRYQGGHNAGHRIVVDGEAFALQLVPCGILYDHITPVIGNGVVVDPAVLLEEVDALDAQGVDTSRLVVSGNAHLIMPYHQRARPGDGALLGQERPRHDQARASGRPTPTRRPGSGLRVQDLLDDEDLPPEARRGPQGEERRPGQGVQPAAALGRGDRPATTSTSYAPRIDPDGGRHGGPPPRRARPRGPRPARGRPGDLPRPRPRHLSLRHVVQPGGRRRLHRLGHRPRATSTG